MKKGKSKLNLAIALVCIILFALILRDTIVNVKITSNSAGTLAGMSNIKNAIDMYHAEYGYYPSFESSSELVEILQSQNEKKIAFWTFSNSELNERGQIVDRFNNPIIIMNHEFGFTFISAGENGIFDELENTDDLVLHLKNSQPI